MVAKDIQPRLRDDAAVILASPVDRGHGRIERRQVTACALLAGDCAWPGARQVFVVARDKVLCFATS